MPLCRGPLVSRVVSALRLVPAEAVPGVRALRRQVGVAIGVRLSLAGRQSSILRSARLGDLSATGAFVEAAFQVAEGSRLVLVVPLRRGGEAIDLHAEVRWCGARGVGVRFLDLQPHHLRRLEQAFGPLEGRWELAADRALPERDPTDHGWSR